MANYCKGERVPSLEALCRICSTNVVSADWLLGFTDSRTGTAAPVTDTVSASRIAELEREVERLRAENGGLRYALDALGKGGCFEPWTCPGYRWGHGCVMRRMTE